MSLAAIFNSDMGLWFFEWILTISLLTAAACAAARLKAGLERLRIGFVALSGRLWLCCLLLTAGPILTRLALLPVIPVPEPGSHDEFSHYLLGETLAQGRLANPPHPLWENFETFHVLNRPVYASMEPPGNGAFLAAGKRFFGHPWFGVLLSVAAMNAAAYWMLLQWFSPPWALAVGGLFALRLGILSYWANSYWSGAVAAAGGCLVLGALPGLLRGSRRCSVLAGVGASALLLTRPLEGAAACLPVLVLFLIRAWRTHDTPRMIGASIPALLVLGVAATGLASYNRAITGDPLQAPHQLNRSEYACVPYLLWQDFPARRTYRYEVIRKFYEEFELPFVRQAKASPFDHSLGKLVGFHLFYIGPGLTLPLLVLMRRPRFHSRQSLLFPLAAVAGVFAIHTGVAAGFHAHYFAPVLGAFLLLVVAGLQSLTRVGDAFRAHAIFAGIAVTSLVMLILAARLPVEPWQAWKQICATWYSPHRQNMHRARLISQLDALGGKHLIVVRYGASHDILDEWVYNEPDLEGAAVLWARESPGTPELLRHYEPRRKWLLDCDRDCRLDAYPRGGDAVLTSNSLPPAP